MALAESIALLLVVLGSSAVPFVPTGELVSGAAALSNGSKEAIMTVFGISWLASLAGDTLLLVEARLGRRHLQRWLSRRAFAGRVEQMQAQIAGHGAAAVISGRLIPGGRAPVIIALGLSRYPVLPFLGADAVACAIWAFLYTIVGSVGGRLAGGSVWGVLLGVAVAVGVSGLIRLLPRRRWLDPPPPPD